jgi:hypothetical protein
MKGSNIIMQGLFESAICKVLSAGFVNFLFLFVVKRFFEKALKITFVEFLKKDLSIAISNSQNVLKQIKNIGVLVMLIKLGLNSRKELLHHHAQTEVVIPATHVQLLFVDRKN